MYLKDDLDHLLCISIFQTNVSTINYLSNYIFDITSLEETPFNRFLNDMKEVIPSMNALGYYSNEQGKYISYDEASGIEKEWLNKYEILQYNYLFDKENRSEVFFRVNSNEKKSLINQRLLFKYLIIINLC